MKHSHRIVLLILSLCIPVTAATPSTTNEEYGSGSNTFLNFYQKIISPAKGGNRCPMHPSCSQYSKMALAQSPVSGTVKTFDRLIRCGQDRQSYENHEETGKIYDPPDPKTEQAFCGGTISPEKEVILDLTIPNHYSDSITARDFFLLTGRFSNALQVSYEELYTSPPDSLNYKLFLTGKLQIASADYAGFQRLYHIYSSHNLLNAENQAAFDILLAKSFYFQSDFTQALTALTIIDTGSCSQFTKDEVCFLSSLIFLQQGERSKTIAAANVISENSSRLAFAKSCLSIDSLLPVKKFRNPIIAGVMSAFFPGLGYAYSGRHNTAIASAVINLLFIGTAVEAFRHKNYILGSTSAFVGSGWYIGNIYGSFTSASKYNRSLTIGFIKQFTTNF